MKTQNKRKEPEGSGKYILPLGVEAGGRCGGAKGGGGQRAASDRGNYLKSGWVVRPQPWRWYIKFHLSWRRDTPPAVTIGRRDGGGGGGGQRPTTPTTNAAGKTRGRAGRRGGGYVERPETVFVAVRGGERAGFARLLSFVPPVGRRRPRHARTQVKRSGGDAMLWDGMGR